jgi:hypothetical protein
MKRAFIRQFLENACPRCITILSLSELVSPHVIASACPAGWHCAAPSHISQPYASDVFNRGGQVIKRKVHLPAEQINQHRRRATIRHVPHYCIH